MGPPSPRLPTTGLALVARPVFIRPLSSSLLTSKSAASIIQLPSTMRATAREYRQLGSLSMAPQCHSAISPLNSASPTPCQRY